MYLLFVLVLLQLLMVTVICNQRVCPVCFTFRKVQLQPPPPNDQCPCVKPPGSNECLSYDSRLQAANIDEALYTFPDFSRPDTSSRPLVSAGGEQEAGPRQKSVFGLGAPKKMKYQPNLEYKCDTEECQACKRMVTMAFNEAQEIDEFDSKSINGTQFGIDQEICLKKDKLLQSVKTASNVTVRQLSAEMREVVALLKPKISKRDAKTPAKDNLLGLSTTIGCNYKKGDEIAQGWSGLCSLCWQWRKLPNNYFPVLLNEISCDSSDDGCLSGFGNCRPVMRAISVLRNLADSRSPHWVQESINTIAACECQVELGTPLHSLVIR